MEKDSKLLYDLDAFIKTFSAIFGDSNQEKATHIKIPSL